PSGPRRRSRCRCCSWRAARTSRSRSRTPSGCAARSPATRAPSSSSWTAADTASCRAGSTRASPGFSCYMCGDSGPGHKGDAMIIGVPREIKPGEQRVALTPAGARALVEAAHGVLVERGAGAGSGISDGDYAGVGAELVSVDDVWRRAELVLKV